MVDFVRPVFSWSKEFPGGTFDVTVNGLTQQQTMPSSAMDGFKAGGGGGAQAGSVAFEFGQAVQNHANILLVTSLYNTPTPELAAPTFRIVLTLQIGQTWAAGDGITFNGTLNGLDVGHSGTVTVPVALEGTGSPWTITTDVNWRYYWSPKVAEYRHDPDIVHQSYGSSAPLDPSVYSRNDFGVQKFRAITLEDMEAADIFDEYAANTIYAVDVAKRNISDVLNTLQKLFVEIAAGTEVTWWRGFNDSVVVLLTRKTELRILDFVSEADGGILRYNGAFVFQEP